MINGQTFKFIQVKASAGELHRVLNVLKPILTKPLLEILKVNTKVDAICVPVEYKERRTNLSSKRNLIYDD